MRAWTLPRCNTTKRSFSIRQATPRAVVSLSNCLTSHQEQGGSRRGWRRRRNINFEFDLWPISDQAAEQRARPCADFGAGSQPVIFLTCMMARAHLSTAPPQNDRWNICIPTGQCQSYPPRHSGVIVEGQKLVRLRIDKTVPFGFPVVSFPDPRVLTKPRSDASAHSSNHTCTPPIHNARATPDGHHLRPSVHQISGLALNHRLSEREPYLRWATGDGMAAVRIVA